MWQHIHKHTYTPIGTSCFHCVYILSCLVLLLLLGDSDNIAFCLTWLYSSIYSDSNISDIEWKRETLILDREVYFAFHLGVVIDSMTLLSSLECEYAKLATLPTADSLPPSKLRHQKLFPLTILLLCKSIYSRFILRLAYIIAFPFSTCTPYSHKEFFFYQ